MLTVIINEDQKNILLRKVLADESHLKQIVESSSLIASGGKRYRLTISEEAADQIRDLCGKSLQQYGLDKDYQPTQEGSLLEELIDILYEEHKEPQ